MFDVFKLLSKSNSLNVKEKIDLKLKSIKNVIDWSNFEMNEIFNQIDLVDLYKCNEINENIIWNSIAKLSIDLYLDYEYYKDFTFLNKHKGKDYDYRLRMLGYIEENGYWVSKTKPEKDLIIEYIFMNCLYQSISKRMTVEQQRNGETFDTGNTCDVIRISTNASNVISCPFCDLQMTTQERECRRCEATEEEITVLRQQTTCIDNLDVNQIRVVDEVFSDPPSRDVEIDLYQRATCTSCDNPVRATCFFADVSSVCDEPIINKIEEKMTSDNLKGNTRTEEDHSDKGREYSDKCDDNDIQSLELNDKGLYGNRLDDDESLRESYRGSGDKQQYYRQCQVHETIDSDISKMCLGNSMTSITGISAKAVPNQPIAGDNKSCDSRVSEPLGESIVRNSHISPRESPLSGDMSMMPDIKAALEVDLNGKWPCKMCGLVNEQSFLSCVACSAPRMATWTCQHCSADNKISTKKCAVCDHDREDPIQGRYCTACRDNEVVAEDEICADCLSTMWLCWRPVCNGVNYGITQYCGHCGIDKAADMTPGASIRILKDGAIDSIWICPHCERMNDDSARDHRCGHCYQARYTLVISAASAIGDSGDEAVQYIVIGGKQHDNVPLSTPTPDNHLYPSLPKSHQAELWTCNNCQVDNMMTSMQCVACESSRFCRHCKIVQTAREGLCDDCLRLRWQCWYRGCEHVNFNRNNKYCEKCRLARQAPGVSGESVLRYIYGRPRLVWVCDHCQQINQNNQRHCSNNACRVPRNENFIWCQFCGWGNIRTWSDFVLRKCGRCDTYF